ncbi:hypothetical protein ABKE32_000460 [Escherichia albertii]|uniref:hypothetical protein n=1 Tax=Escherichia albertii TaxID=208962 RepID=UPI000931663A|nr:hypothetical protein [Escherichia albertii]
MSSKRNLRRKQCGAKIRYASAEEAVAAIRILHRKKGHQGHIHNYRCPFCHGWHIGHAPGQNGIGSAWRGWSEKR